MHYLYVAITESRKYCKIGKTENPKQRFLSLRTEAKKKFGSPMQVIALWPAPRQCWQDEQDVQARFSQHEVKPCSEWFWADPEIIAFAAQYPPDLSLVPKAARYGDPVYRLSKRTTPPKAGPGRPKKPKPGADAQNGAAK